MQIGKTARACLVGQLLEGERRESMGGQEKQNHFIITALLLLLAAALRFTAAHSKALD